jgi:sporulation integral membrane protein YtvI
LLPDGVTIANLNIANDLTKWIEGLNLGNTLANLAGQAPNMISNISSFIVSLIVFIMASYFITSDYPSLRIHFTNTMSEETKEYLNKIKKIVLSAFGGYVKSRLILSICVMIILLIGFIVIKQPYGVLLAIALAILDFIPIIGSGTVLIPWSIILIIQSNYAKALELMAIYCIIFVFRHMAEPKVLDKHAGLSPLLSLFGIYIGMKTGGVLGMVIGPILMMVILNLYNIGIFDKAIRDLKLAFYDILAILD